MPNARYDRLHATAFQSSCAILHRNTHKFPFAICIDACGLMRACKYFILHIIGFVLRIERFQVKINQRCQRWAEATVKLLLNAAVKRHANSQENIFLIHCCLHKFDVDGTMAILGTSNSSLEFRVIDEWTFLWEFFFY